jgi:hypothetical protein
MMPSLDKPLVENYFSLSDGPVRVGLIGAERGLPKQRNALRRCGEWIWPPLPTVRKKKRVI